MSKQRLADYEFSFDLNDDSERKRLVPEAYCDNPDCFTYGRKYVRNLGIKKDAHRSATFCVDCGYALFWKGA